MTAPPDAQGRSVGGVIPPRAWFDRDPLDLARDLLGATLTRRSDDGDVTLRITEVEAYRGESDPASHAFRGLSERNRAMFGAGGHLYVYRHLGLHHCANVVAGPEGAAGGVLVRAGEVVAGVSVARARRAAAGVTRADTDLARGPARLTVALAIDFGLYGADLLDPDGDLVLRNREAAPAAVAEGPRVGVNGPGADPEAFPWRLWLAGDPTVSTFRPGGKPRTRKAAPPGDGPH